MCRQIFQGLATVQRDFTQYFRQVRRLIATVLRLRAQAAGQQIGRIAFKHQASTGNLAHQRVQVRAPAFIADPAGDADVQVQIEVTEQRLLFTGEAMHHGRR
ncbi:hypothetical protein D3C75_1173990 [compost metagenome]